MKRGAIENLFSALIDTGRDSRQVIQMDTEVSKLI